MTEYMEPPYSIPGVVHPKQVLSPGSFRQSSNFVKGSAGWKLDGDGSVDIFGLEASLLIADTSDTSCFVALFEAATGNLVPKTDAGLTYNAGTAALTATTFVGALTGNASGSSGSCTGNAATATALETARTIGGVSFNGTGNINLPGVNTAGNQDTSGTAADATVLETARTINGVSFNGSANITVTAAAGTLSGSTLASGVTASSLTSVGTLASLAISSGTNISPDSAGAGQFKVTGTDYTGFIANDGTAMHVGHNSSSRGLYFMTDETTRLAITGAGLVGIGTTSPSEQLHVYEAGTGNDWRGRAVFGGQDQVVVAGSYAGKAVVGAHNTALNAWGDLILNYAGVGAARSVSAPPHP